MENSYLDQNGNLGILLKKVQHSQHNLGFWRTYWLLNKSKISHVIQKDEQHCIGSNHRAAKRAAIFQIH